MKKLSFITSIALSILMVMGVLAGCGSSASTTTQTPAAEAPAATAEAPAAEAPAAETPAAEGPAAAPAEKKIIAFSLSQTDTFLATLRDAVKKYVEEAGYEFQYNDAQKDQNTQIANIQQYAADPNVVGIIICPKEADAAAQLTAAAGDLPIAYVNRQPADGDLVEGKVVFAGSDEYVAGTTQGEFLADYFKDKEDKTLNVVILLGELGHPGTIGRTEGVKKILKDAGFELNILVEQTGNWAVKEGQDIVAQALSEHDDIDCVIANNDDMALGAVAAIQAAGLSTADIPVVGVDATEPGFASLKEGGLTMTVFQDAAGQGEAAVKAILDIIAGQNVPKLNYVPFIEVSANSDAAGLLN